MDTIDLEREWAVLERLLPADWRDLARERQAIRRERGVTDPSVLLRLLLMHAGTGLSLRSTVARAGQQGLARLSAVALMKRLRTSEKWLAALTCRLFARTRFGQQVQQKPVTTRRVRVVDATTVQEIGSTETDWRVHYSVGLWDLQCDHFQITGAAEGETFKRFPVRRGEILMGDRGYCHREGVAHVVKRGADVVVRLNLNNFPLLDADEGKPFQILEQLRGLSGFAPEGWAVQYEWNGKRYPARLCAIRKTEAAGEKAKAQLRKREKKTKNGKVQRLLPETLESAEYIYVLTTVGESELTAGEVLELYRLRWQIELVFKRLKSLLHLGELPKRTDSSSRAWLQAKLLVALLIERLTENAKLFSPWGHDFHVAQPVA